MRVLVQVCGVVGAGSVRVFVSCCDVVSAGVDECVWVSGVFWSVCGIVCACY